jgi:pimeloyl-ACP methyl ester carboxylesterase
MKVYFISGLGINRNAFVKLKLSDIEPIYLDWLEPEYLESLQQYARRMARAIPETDIPVIVGLSFGGILAIEISKIRPVKRVVLISSAKHQGEKGPLLNVLKYIPLYKLISPELYLRTLRIWAPIFGIHTSQSRAGFLAMLEQSSANYLQWATRQVVHWDNTEIPDNLIHIHGDRDPIFPIARVQATQVVEGGDHGMIFTRATEISAILEKSLR